MDFETFDKINKRLADARRKHPAFVSSRFHGVCVLTEEVGEVAQACDDGDIEKAKDELLGVIAEAVRLYSFLGGVE